MAAGNPANWGRPAWAKAASGTPGWTRQRGAGPASRAIPARRPGSRPAATTARQPARRAPAPHQRQHHAVFGAQSAGLRHIGIALRHQQGARAQPRRLAEIARRALAHQRQPLQEVAQGVRTGRRPRKKARRIALRLTWLPIPLQVAFEIPVTMPRLAARTHDFLTFQVVELFKQAQALQAAGKDIDIDLGIGEPDFTAPLVGRSAAARGPGWPERLQRAPPADAAARAPLHGSTMSSSAPRSIPGASSSRPAPRAP